MTFSKRIDKARDAFARGDARASAPAHDPNQMVQAVVLAQEKHGYLFT